MPQHSSKNYYKAELEEYDKLEEKEWEYWEHEKDYWDDRLCGSSCCCKDNTWSSAFDTDWTKSVGKYTARKPRCSCDFCYEYQRDSDRKKFVHKNFTDKEILETLQGHLRETNCWCYERVRSHILKNRVSKWLHPRRSSLPVYIPNEYQEDVLTDCVVQRLDFKLRAQYLQLHQDMELSAKNSLLAKYGLTLEEYKQTRIERQVMLDELQKVEPKQNVSKQKFYKVRCQK